MDTVAVEFPISVEMMLTVLGTATLAEILTLWLKAYLKDWRYTTLLVLGLAEVGAILAQCIMFAWQPDAEALFVAALIGFFGASLAVFGYEGISNALGIVGIGKRSDRALRDELELRKALSQLGPRG